MDNSSFNKEIATKVKELILADLSLYASVPELAKKMGTNAYSLRKAFKEKYGISLAQFSRQERIKEAQRLLLTTNHTLHTIAGMTGYTEGTNFQVAFKEVTGMTPGEWRKSAAG